MFGYLILNVRRRIIYPYKTLKTFKGTIKMVYLYNLLLINRRSFWNPSRFFRTMKISKYLIFLTLFSVEPKRVNQRLANFRKHHRKYHGKNLKKSIRKIAIQKKVCTATTCIKCLSVMKTLSNVTSKTKYCAIILTLEDCCPIKLMVISGF